ncbi:FIBCD1 [Bugula neritina]|uniref:FIBCD1 n=1 Tax=Bugula neritina TaxID=10212 RepID=A0A7J7IVT9_BUGNE|nr:FIBCD1 [Bugula neritina]
MAIMTYARYSSFNVGGSSTDYKLAVSGYSGTAGNSLAYSNGYRFSTNDNDNDVKKDHCAITFHGAWWYKACHESNLNGKYLNGTHSSFADGVNWKAWKGFYYSLKTTEMKFREIF